MHRVESTRGVFLLVSRSVSRHHILKMAQPVVQPCALIVRSGVLVSLDLVVEFSQPTPDPHDLSGDFLSVHSTSQRSIDSTTYRYPNGDEPKPGEQSVRAPNRARLGLPGADTMAGKGVHTTNEHP